jgi:hypothetical protein
MGVLCALLLLIPLNVYADTVTVQFTGPGGAELWKPDVLRVPL